ncbi:MAG: TerB family tellurite resistance protein [Ignavibacteriales bacterium]|nr:TerB family tellurite resistance protein [Ignavibacteriales bacterium]
MEITVIDRSNYFKGLLLLIRKDSQITESEIQLMKRIGKTLGFDPEFCENAIDEILENKYIVDMPPEFSSKELAIKFIKDGLAIAFSDNAVHPSEAEWLKAAAEKNDLDLSWFHQVCVSAETGRQLPTHLEVDDLIVR